MKEAKKLKMQKKKKMKMMMMMMMVIMKEKKEKKKRKKKETKIRTCVNACGFHSKKSLPFNAKFFFLFIFVILFLSGTMDYNNKSSTSFMINRKRKLM